MLYGEFAESKKDTIPLPEKKADDVEELLRCRIPNPTTKPVDETNFELLLAFSEEYQMEEIRSKVERFMLEKVRWTLGPGDEQVLRILVIGSECVKRCAMEFGLDKSKPLFPDLPSDVAASLMLYAFQPAVTRKNTAGRRCSYFRVQVITRGDCRSCEKWLENRTASQCLHCNTIVCTDCVTAGNLESWVCSGTLKNEPEARAMLDRMF